MGVLSDDVWPRARGERRWRRAVRRVTLEGAVVTASLCALSPRTDRCTVYVRLYQRGLMDRAYGASVRRACCA